MRMLVRPRACGFFSLVSVGAMACGGHGEMAVGHALCSKDEVRDTVHKCAFAAKNDDFHAGMRVKMHMHARDDLLEIIVLDAVELVADIAGVVVEHDGERAHDFFPGKRAFLFDEGVAYQVADDLAAIFGKAAFGHERIESDEEVFRHGD